MGDGKGGEHRVGAGFSLSPNHVVRRLPSFFYKDNPDSLLSFDLTYHYSLNPQSWPNWLRTTGPWGSILYSYLPEAESTRYSNRHEVAIIGGYEQTLSVVFLSLGGGLGVAFNKFNFGGGELPALETSLNLLLEVKGGVQLCLYNGFCGRFFGGYHGERSVAGSPHYYDQGWFVGLGALFTIPEPVSEPSPRQPPPATEIPTILLPPKCPLSPRKKGFDPFLEISIPFGEVEKVSLTEVLPGKLRGDLDKESEHLLPQDPKVKMFVRVRAANHHIARDRVKEVRSYLAKKIGNLSRVMMDAEDQNGNICPDADSLNVPKRSSEDREENLVVLEYFREGQP